MLVLGDMSIVNVQGYDKNCILTCRMLLPGEKNRHKFDNVAIFSVRSRPYCGFSRNICNVSSCLRPDRTCYYEISNHNSCKGIHNYNCKYNISLRLVYPRNLACICHPPNLYTWEMLNGPSLGLLGTKLVHFPALKSEWLQFPFRLRWLL